VLVLGQDGRADGRARRVDIARLALHRDAMTAANGARKEAEEERGVGAVRSAKTRNSLATSVSRSSKAGKRRCYTAGCGPIIHAGRGRPPYVASVRRNCAAAVVLSSVAVSLSAQDRFGVGQMFPFWPCPPGRARQQEFDGGIKKGYYNALAKYYT
jgi:hypothetical protein